MSNHKRNRFNLSNKKNFSCDQGELIPCGLTEVLPGDIFQHGTSAFIRLAPMLAPVFSQINCTMMHFFVPHRLVWDEWEDFITGGPAGTSTPVHPTITFASGVAVGSLGDYLGIPPGFNNLEVSALPYRAYALIWNEWIRDQDLQTELTIDLTSGADTTTNTTLQNICWEKDRFTRARPFEQKGPQVTIPIGQNAPVTRVNNAPAVRLQLAGTNTYGNNEALYVASTANNSTLGNVNSSNDFSIDPNNSLVADLSAVTGIPVTELRLALSLQRFEEISAQYGSRYVEYILSRFGVRSSDARLQRPELLGRTKQVVQISEVLATAEGTNTDVGDLKGHGIGAMRSNRYTKHFEEHGYVLTLFAVQPKTFYPQGIRKTWLRRDKYDYFQQETQHIGQQEIQNQEVYAGAASLTGTFGWGGRYDEYREEPNTIAGEFRTSTLDFWHQARIFSSEPALNAAFVSSNPTERIFAVPSQDVLYVSASHRLKARRVISAVPTSFIK